MDIYTKLFYANALLICFVACLDDVIGFTDYSKVAMTICNTWLFFSLVSIPLVIGYIIGASCCVTY